MSASVQNLLAQIGQDGWGGLDLNPKNTDAMTRALMADAQAEAQIVARAMTSPDGQRFLRWLVSKTLMRPPTEFEASATTVETYALIKARREGQNGVVWMILSALDVASGETPSTGNPT